MVAPHIQSKIISIINSTSKANSFLYCKQKADAIFFYRSKISEFIDDNKALMRRMYGSLVETSLPDLPETPKTPGDYFFPMMSHV